LTTDGLIDIADTVGRRPTCYLATHREHHTRVLALQNGGYATVTTFRPVIVFSNQRC